MHALDPVKNNDRSVITGDTWFDLQCLYMSTTKAK